MKKVFLYILLPIFLLLTVCSCIEKKQNNSHLWGDDSVEDTVMRKSGVISYEEMISNGEIIVGTLSGPDTYYDYRGVNVGTQYLLMKMFAEQVGLKIRMELCKDTLDVLERLKAGDIDVALLKLPVVRAGNDYLCCANGEGTAGWYVNAMNKSLSDAINEWYKPGMVAEVQKEEDNILSDQLVVVHAFSYYLNRDEGIISQYDNLFKLYSADAGIDWRLLASICYQESRFDPEARSFAGASGLMQLMPKTAESMGLSGDEIFNPEKNVSVSARYINKLKASFKDVANEEENLKFVLAGYNGGTGHIRDAMALAKADGKDSKVWNNVAPYVLALSDPSVYNRPTVKFGYMRGRETVNYVSSVFKRWYDYKGVIGGPAIYSAEDLSIENIVGSGSASGIVIPPPPGSENETSEQSSVQTPATSEKQGEGSEGAQQSESSTKRYVHRETSDYSIPVPATTERKAKYDVE